MGTTCARTCSTCLRPAPPVLCGFRGRSRDCEVPRPVKRVRCGLREGGRLDGVGAEEFEIDRLRAQLYERRAQRWIALVAVSLDKEVYHIRLLQVGIRLDRAQVDPRCVESSEGARERTGLVLAEREEDQALVVPAWLTWRLPGLLEHHAPSILTHRIGCAREQRQRWVGVCVGLDEVSGGVIFGAIESTIPRSLRPVRVEVHFHQLDRPRENLSEPNSAEAQYRGPCTHAPYLGQLGTRVESEA
mmetsp:Transcript_4768/g.12700  ORF Transcript_4768/g.12700 Transcript_4768/m.12700 type:complete len:245 (-) Transcript_4768:1091-1825(-)